MTKKHNQNKYRKNLNGKFNRKAKKKDLWRLQG